MKSPANPLGRPVCGAFYIGLTDKMIVQMQRAVVYLAEDAEGRGKSVEIVKKKGYNG